MVEEADVLVEGWTVPLDIDAKNFCKSVSDIRTVCSEYMTGLFGIGIVSKKRLARNKKIWAAMRTHAEANTFPVNNGCKKKNEELPSIELTGAKMLMPKFKGLLES
ncbi:MAG: hypothetical protein APF81_10625 [Desulfosporosinus sp. BRH_c37]|nr:MAG: hypothetical protein APF81_10625 [Desulfosporosinus sp. BRH_c37]